MVMRLLLMMLIVSGCGGDNGQSGWNLCKVWVGRLLLDNRGWKRSVELCWCGERNNHLLWN